MPVSGGMQWSTGPHLMETDDSFSREDYNSTYGNQVQNSDSLQQNLGNEEKWSKRLKLNVHSTQAGKAVGKKEGRKAE